MVRFLEPMRIFASTRIGHVENFQQPKILQSEVLLQSEKMADGEPPKMTSVKTSKKDFKTVTTTKNRIVKAINACEDDELAIEYIQTELPKALQEYVDALLEAAGLEEKIQTDENYKFLAKLDFQSMVTADRIIDTHVKETRVKSLLDEVQRSNAAVGKV